MRVALNRSSTDLSGYCQEMAMVLIVVLTLRMILILNKHNNNI